MVFKLLIIILLTLNLNIGKAEIIYDKFNISVTQLELSQYQELYKNLNNIELNDNETLKEIILMKNTIDFLSNNNPNFLNALDEKIKITYKTRDFDSKMKHNFMRFQNIRNEFINDYFQNYFNIEELEIILSSIIELKLPISRNNCLTIEGLKELNINEYFHKSFYENFKSNQKEYKTKIDEEIFDVCISNEQLNFINKAIFNFAKQKTEMSFKEFIYRNLI